MIGPSKATNKLGSKTNKILNVNEIKQYVNGGMSNLTYYKTDLAIKEFEVALKMLKDQQ